MEPRRQEFNTCQVGHTSHDTKMIDTVAGPMRIWDWEKYQDQGDYCTGQDDVSMTLDLYGSWEASDWQRATRHTRKAPLGWVYDFGSHIGWYAIAFAKQGHHVMAVDADPANCELLQVNAVDAHVEKLIDIRQTWVEDMPRLPYRDDVRLIKSDVEGSEDEVIRVVRELVHSLQPPMLLECSPEFDTYYTEMIEELIALGYKATVDGARISGYTLGDTQKNVWFE